MNDQEFYRIKNFFKSKYGVDLSKKKVIIEGRLSNYLRNMGYSNYTDYMNDLENDISGNMEKKLVDLLTTNHTYFMRETEHFDLFKNTVLPYLKEKEKSKKDLRIWCGASSSGEEPYTLAMIIKDYFGFEHSKWDTQILATDVSTDILNQAVKGVYSADQIESMPDAWKRRYFKAYGDSGNYIISDEIKKEVLFRKLNLMEPFPFKKKLQVVFLRNVMIYFDEPTKLKVLNKVYENLEDGGYLFLGKTETLDKNSIPFKIVEPSVFRK